MTNKKDLPMKVDAIILVPDTADGFFASLGLEIHLKKQSVTPSVVRIKPYQLGKVSLEDGLLIYMAGFGRGNCMANALNAFIEKFGERIVFWADNHPGNDYILEQADKSCYCQASSTQHPSCISFLKKLWQEPTIKEEWVEAANFLETKIGEENTVAETYKKLMYVGRIEDASGRGSDFRGQLRDFYFDSLLSGKTEGIKISYFSEQCDVIVAKTKEALENLHWSSDFPNLVLLAEADGQVDKEPLKRAAERLSLNYLLVVQHQDIGCSEVTTIIASKPELLPAKYQKNDATQAFLSGQHDEVLKDIYQSLIIPSIKMNPTRTQAAMV